MPVKYTYQPNENTIEIECWGELNIQDIVQYFSKIEEDPSIGKNPIEIVDLSKVRFFNVAYFEASELPFDYETVHNKKQIMGTIFVGVSDFNSGLAELIKIHFRKFMPEHIFISVNSRNKACRDAQRIRDEI